MACSLLLSETVRFSLTSFVSAHEGKLKVNLTLGLFSEEPESFQALRNLWVNVHD